MKVAIVTAGGSGMGAATARRLAQDGYKVAILSSSGKGEALAKELGGIGVTTDAQGCPGRPHLRHGGRARQCGFLRRRDDAPRRDECNRSSLFLGSSVYACEPNSAELASQSP